MPNPLREHPFLGGSDGITALAAISQASAGLALRKAIAKKIDDIRTEVEGKPLDPDFVVKYNIGKISGLKWVLEIINEAEAIVDKVRRE